MSLEQPPEAAARPQSAGPNLLDVSGDNRPTSTNGNDNGNTIASLRPLDTSLYLDGTQSADNRVNGQAQVNDRVNNAVITDNTSAPSDAPYAGGPSHQYTVKNGDSLWKIAIHSLSQEHPGERIQGEVIWDRMREIVEANRAQHPEFKDNPFFIKKGDQLVLPGQAPAEAPARAQSHGSANHEAGHHEAGHHRHERHEGHHGHGRHHSADSQATGADSRATDASSIADNTRGASGPVPDNKLGHALKAEACHQADHIGTVGDCARGPRQTFAKFGIKLDPQSAVSQGQLLESSGYFDKVSEKDIQPGDYGYRHWSEATKHRRGLGDLGDSFIVTDCSGPGIKAANDHHFNVPPAGGYYAKGITFLRPNAKFYAAYEHYKETGEMTVIRKQK